MLYILRHSRFLIVIDLLLTVSSSIVTGTYTNTTSLGLNVLSFQRQNRGFRVSDEIGCTSLTTCSTAGPNNKGFLTLTYFNDKSCTGHVEEIYATTLGLCSPTIDGRSVVHSTSTIHLYQETYPTTKCIGQPMEERVPLSSTSCVELMNNKFGSYSMKLLPEETLSHHGVILAGASSTACICSPTAAPTGPTYTPTNEPIPKPTYEPTVNPTNPTFVPSQVPTQKPVFPTYAPTPAPTWLPTCTDFNQCGIDCDYNRYHFGWACVYMQEDRGCLCTGCSLCQPLTANPSVTPTVRPSRPTPVPTMNPTLSLCVDADSPCDCDTQVRRGWTCQGLYDNGCPCTGCLLCPGQTSNPTYESTSKPSFGPTSSKPTLEPSFKPTLEPSFSPPTPTSTTSPTACICNSPAPTSEPTQKVSNVGGGTGMVVVSATQTITSLTSDVASTTVFQLVFTTAVATYLYVPVASVTWISATPISGRRALLLPGMSIQYSVMNVPPAVGTLLQNSGSSLTTAITATYPGLTVAVATAVVLQSTSTPSLAPTSVQKSTGSIDMPKYRYDLTILSTMIVSSISLMLF